MNNPYYGVALFFTFFLCPIKVVVWQFDCGKIKTNLMNSPPESSHPWSNPNIMNFEQLRTWQVELWTHSNLGSTTKTELQTHLNPSKKPKFWTCLARNRLNLVPIRKIQSSNPSKPRLSTRVLPNTNLDNAVFGYSKKSTIQGPTVSFQYNFKTGWYWAKKSPPNILYPLFFCDSDFIY